VDDEGELTYYGVKMTALATISTPSAYPSFTGHLFGTTVILKDAIPGEVRESWFGTPLDEKRVILSPVETLYLMQRGCLSFSGADASLTPGQYLASALPSDPELAEKASVYADMRDQGYIPRTGYKFGHHFRVYARDRTHSDLLVHAVPPGQTLSVSVISRSVRLAHSVKKKMLFACVHPTGIRYIEFGRMKL